MKNSNSKILEFKSTKDPIKVLGAFLSYNHDKSVEENFIKRFRKMKVKLNLWLSRDLTLYGKSLLAKTLGMSQLVYAASMLSVPNAVIRNVQSELCSFLWRNRKDKIKRAVIYQPLKEGGLNFVNFETMVKCLRLAWIKRFLTNSNDSWKAIPNYYFSSYGGLQFLLRCNYNVNYVTKDLPPFIVNFYNTFKSLKMPLNRFRIVNFYFGTMRK